MNPVDAAQNVVLNQGLLGALLLLSVAGNLLFIRLLLKEKDRSSAILREVLTAVNNFVEAQRLREK